jgi:uncharacterized metal-binding protein
MAKPKTTKAQANNASLTCTECGTRNCSRLEQKFPGFCLTESADPKQVTQIVRRLRGNSLDARMARASAEMEGEFYGKATRVEEIAIFAKRVGAKRIGVASCMGLIEESCTFVKVLRAHQLEPYTVVCKVGAVDKTEIGLPDRAKIRPGTHESMCNPILQARLLNAQKTQLNVLVGLCVGHDSLFIKYSKAPVTTLIVKDRVLGHNPAAALYTCNFYYRRLLNPE